jgi:hypothetical protein
MPTAARVLAIDKVADRTPKKCSNCHQVKARDRFSPNLKNGDGLQAHCQDCHRIAEYVRYHDGGGKAAKAAYRARDDVKERRREYERTHKEAAHARVRAYRTSLKGRLHDGRYQARSPAGSPRPRTRSRGRGLPPSSPPMTASLRSSGPPPSLLLVRWSRDPGPPTGRNRWLVGCKSRKKARSRSR